MSSSHATQSTEERRSSKRLRRELDERGSENGSDNGFEDEDGRKAKRRRTRTSTVGYEMSPEETFQAVLAYVKDPLTGAKVIKTHGQKILELLEIYQESLKQQVPVSTHGHHTSREPIALACLPECSLKQDLTNGQLSVDDAKLMMAAYRAYKCKNGAAEIRERKKEQQEELESRIREVEAQEKASLKKIAELKAANAALEEKIKIAKAAQAEAEAEAEAQAPMARVVLKQDPQINKDEGVPAWLDNQKFKDEAELWMVTNGDDPLLNQEIVGMETDDDEPPVLTVTTLVDDPMLARSPSRGSSYG